MPENIVTRRDFLKAAGVLAAPVLATSEVPPLAAAAAEAGRQLKVVCVGGYSDDPESGCAGTLSRYAELGHSVTVLYLTRGERGVRGKGLEEAGKIRTAECEKACQVMGKRREWGWEPGRAITAQPSPHPRMILVYAASEQVDSGDLFV